MCQGDRGGLDPLLPFIKECHHVCWVEGKKEGGQDMALYVHLGSAVSLPRIPPSTSRCADKGRGGGQQGSQLAHVTSGLRMTTVGRGGGRRGHGWLGAWGWAQPAWLSD